MFLLEVVVSCGFKCRTGPIIPPPYLLVDFRITNSQKWIPRATIRFDGTLSGRFKENGEGSAT
ncbi:MAG: hypothetical protein MRY81_20600, partial [Donghicola eburneus]